MKYGPYERNVLDFWRAKSDKPTPLFVYIHGGGWLAGDKSLLQHDAARLKVDFLPFFLSRGISVASINYRYSSIAKLPAPVHDAARAIQFLRSKADEWNLDKSRIAASGTSAGACTSLWLAYHDDLADPNSPDPVARESTRLCAAVVFSPQTSIDPKVIVPWVGDKVFDHPMISRAVGAKNRQEALAHYDEEAPLYREFSPINHVSAGDPPTMLIFPMKKPIPALDVSSAIHHPIMGVKLKEKGGRRRRYLPALDPGSAQGRHAFAGRFSPQVPDGSMIWVPPPTRVLRPVDASGAVSQRLGRLIVASSTPRRWSPDCRGPGQSRSRDSG